MKSKFLFPAWCNIVGYFMALPGFILGYLNIINNYQIPGFGFRLRQTDSFFESSFENFTNELAIFLVVIGLFLIAFSKGKIEDELRAKVRLNSLYWSVMIYYVFLFVNIIWSKLFGEIPFVGAHIFELSIFMMLVIFIGRFAYLNLLSRELRVDPRFLPNKPFKAFGIVLSVVSLSIMLYAMFLKNDWDNDMVDFAFGFSMLGLFVWAFSKHQTEDEMTMQLRLESLQLAVYLNYGILLLATLLFYSFSYLFVLAFSTLSLLLFFIIRMEFINYRNNRQLENLEGEIGHEK